jgi:glutamate:GABA antiporter
VIGGLSALVAIIATIAYGGWFYLVAGIAALSLLVAVGIYWLGNITSARAAHRPTVEHA